MYILMYVFWLLLCGKVTVETLLLGVPIVAALAALEYKLFGYTPKTEGRVLKKTPLFLAYAGVLVWEIFKAAFVVLRDILFPKYRLAPTLVTFEAGLKTDIGRFLLANSITLTPGTITVKVEGDAFTVHCLDRSMLDTSEDATFLRWIRRLEA
ncbi:MAG: Na+/H+ antiporter subunit E [Clostridia bacterium]|nr:Na+/H+ antiporter subunit E [Clostridia bacterium]